MQIPFLKMHGLGNDYVYLDGISHPELPGGIDLGELARRASDRHRGVGGDGIILILPPQSPGADARMRIFNADGSEGEMCGNGVRCVMRHVHALGRAGRELAVETLAGLIRGEIGTDGRVAVDMGVPGLSRQQTGFTRDLCDEELELGGAKVRLTAVSMGNPHAVSFWPPGTDLHRLAREIGPEIERAPFAPERTNAEFVAVEGPGRLRMEVWERGSGITEACGTGACAALVAAAHTTRSGRRAVVALRGGELEIDWRADGHVVMTGPASFSFSGIYAWPDQEEELRW